MKKRKSLLKTSVLAVGLLEVINKLIDSSSIASTSSRTGGSYYHWKHGDIYYRTFGDKNNPPLLLVHDLTVSSSNYEWLSLGKELGDTYCVYCIDLIGCGKSDKPFITYTNYFYVQMITDFVTEVIGRKTDVAVTGLSSSFIIMANALNKDLFDQIMMVNPTSISTLKRTPDDRSKVLLKLFELPVIGRTLYYFLTNRSNIEYHLTEDCFFNAFHMERSMIKAYYDAAHSGNGNGKYLLASLQGNYLYTDITRALKNAENRILVVTGQYTKSAKELTRGYRDINPNIVPLMISDSKLLPQLENSEEMLELLYHF